jgi:hypothetical protein
MYRLALYVVFSTRIVAKVENAPRQRGRPRTTTGNPAIWDMHD